MGMTRDELLERRRSFSWKSGQLLSYDELSQEELEVVSEEFFSEMRRERREPYSLLALVLSRFGVMCPHARACRRWDDSCSSCGAFVLRRTEESPKTPEGRAADGR